MISHYRPISKLFYWVPSFWRNNPHGINDKFFDRLNFQYFFNVHFFSFCISTSGSYKIKKSIKIIIPTGIKVLIIVLKPPPIVKAEIPKKMKKKIKASIVINNKSKYINWDLSIPNMVIVRLIILVSMYSNASKNSS